MSSLTDAFKGLFGSDKDAVSEAGQAQQGRIIQSIDIVNNNLDMPHGIREQIERGEVQSIEVLQQGLNSAINTLTSSTDAQINSIVGGRDAAKAEINKSAADQFEILKEGFFRSRDSLIDSFNKSSSSIQAALGRAKQFIDSSVSSASDAVGQARDAAVERLQPFSDVGLRGLERAEELLNNPLAQAAFIEDNPFFELLADETTNRLLNNKAASGKVGSGGTAKGLQDQLVLLGAELINQNVAANFGLADRGLTATLNQNAAELSAGDTIADLFFRGGTAKAAAETQAGQNLANLSSSTGRALANLTSTASNNAASVFGDRGRALAALDDSAGVNIASSIGSGGTNIANAHLGTAASIANARTIGASGQASALQLATGQIVNGLNNLGASEANTILGERSAENDALNKVIGLAALAKTEFGGSGSGGINPPALISSNIPSSTGFVGPTINAPTFSNPLLGV